MPEANDDLPQLREIHCVMCGEPLLAYVQEWVFVRPLIVDMTEVVLDWSKSIPDDHEILNYYCPNCHEEYLVSEIDEMLKESLI